MMLEGHDLKIVQEARGRVSGDGVQLAFGFWPGRGAPIVALHGLTASCMSFIAVAERLEGKRALFAIDLRGRGDSDKPDGPYGMTQHARDVAAAMCAMGLGSSIVVGHSMGAFAAAALAAENPELVSGLILIDGGYLPAFATGPNEQQVADGALMKRIMQLRAVYPSREAYRDFWRTQPHFPAEDWGPWVEAFLNYEIGGEPPHLQPKASTAGVTADLAAALQRDDIIANLRAIRTPVLIVRAEHGFTPDAPPLYPDALMEQFRACVPQMEEELITGTTHYTILLGDRGATRLANLIDNLSERCRSVDSAAPEVTARIP